MKLLLSPLCVLVFLLPVTVKASDERQYAYCVADTKYKQGAETRRYITRVFSAPRKLGLVELENKFDDHMLGQWGIPTEDRMTLCVFYNDYFVAERKNSKHRNTPKYDVRSSLFMN